MITGIVLSFVFVLATPAAGSAGFGAVKPGSADQEALALVANARVRLEKGELLAGIRLLRQALARDPASGEIREELGLALAQARLSGEAITQLRAVPDLTPEGSAMLGLLLLERAESVADLAEAVAPLRAGLTAVPQGPQIRINLVGVLLELGKAQEAWDALQPVLGERVEDPRVWLAAARALRELERHDEAAEYFRLAARVPAFREESVRGLIESHKASGDFGAAARELEEIIGDEATVAGFVEMAVLHLRGGDEEQGVALLERALEQEPDHEQAILLRALVALGNADLDTAEGMYRRVLENDPENPMAAMGLARVLVALREFDEARGLLAMVWRQVTAGDLRDPDELDEVAQERANLELVAGNPDEAEAWLKRLEGKPLTGGGVFLWAEFFRQREDWRGGLDWLAQVESVEDPVLAVLTDSVRVEFLLAAGKDQAAERILGEMLAGDESTVVAGLNALQRRRENARVVDEAARALERLDSPSELLFIQAAALERLGRWDESVTAFRALLKQAPEHHLALNYLGYMFADRNVNLQEALQLIQAAVDLEPFRGSYLDSLGWVYFRMGKWDKAEKYLTRAARLEPDSATIREHLGDLARELGQLSQAEEFYRQALTLEMEEEGQEERIRSKLSELEHEGQ